MVHCTGSSSTQPGLVAGIAALGSPTQVIGISDDGETDIKKARVLQLANEALETLGLATRIQANDVEIIAASDSVYGVPEASVFDAVRTLAQTEGLMADPVYEGRALSGLTQLIATGRIPPEARVLLMHLGGTPGVHAYANQYDPVTLTRFEG